VSSYLLELQLTSQRKSSDCSKGYLKGLTPPNKNAFRAVLALVFVFLVAVIAYTYSVNIASTLGLVVTSLGLIIATLRLKEATDNLVSATENMARNQILPRLSTTSHYWNEEKQALTFQIKNTGIGTAYSVKATAVTPTGVFFGIEPDLKKLDLGVDETWTYSLTGIATRAYREMRVDFEYSDAKGYAYPQSIVIPK
jgi:hypothetical protein